MFLFALSVAATVILALALCVSCTMAEDKAVEPLKAVSDGTSVFATNFFKVGVHTTFMYEDARIYARHEILSE